MIQYTFIFIDIRELSNNIEKRVKGIIAFMLALKHKKLQYLYFFLNLHIIYTVSLPE